MKILFKDFGLGVKLGILKLYVDVGIEFLSPESICMSILDMVINSSLKSINTFLTYSSDPYLIFTGITQSKQRIGKLGNGGSAAIVIAYLQHIDLSLRKSYLIK